jgi:hypothetical protein
MMKKVLLVSLVALMTGCSTVKKEDLFGDSVKVPFMSGEVILTISKKGQFESLTASGVARVTSSLPSAREEAFIIANLRAKQKIVEFMETEMDGEKFVKNTTTSIQKSRSFGSPSVNDIDSTIAYEVQENISSKARSILRGVHVESTEFNPNANTLKVTVRTGVLEIGAASQVRSLMNR